MAREQFRGRRMTKVWGDIPSGVNGFTANAIVLLGGTSVGQVPKTVLRMIGEYIIGPTSAPTALDRASITVAIGVVSTDSFNLGATAMPDPTEPAYPWLYWKQHALRFPGTGVQEGSAEVSVRQAFDIGSQRKMSIQQTLAMVVEYTDSTGTPPLFFMAGITRVLFAQ